MGGQGSGRWYRWDRKKTLEECLSIDIRIWSRRDLLHAGTSFSWRWSCGGEETARVMVYARTDAVVLSYRVRPSGEDWRSVDEAVIFTRTACHLGGERLWFRCPHCHRQAAKLYMRRYRFFCRRCCGLPYSSQQETVLDRANRRSFKLRRKLGDDGGIGDMIWKKPKGMHQRTFERYLARIDERDEIASQAFHVAAMRIMGKGWP